LQDRLATLDQPLQLQQELMRSYSAHLWVVSEGVHQQDDNVDDLALDSDASELNASDIGRLYEDPEYLQQYVIYWGDNDVGTKTIPAEHQAYASSENTNYLRKVSDFYASLCLGNRAYCAAFMRAYCTTYTWLDFCVNYILLLIIHPWAVTLSWLY